jgi:hypothetical protein
VCVLFLSSFFLSFFSVVLQFELRGKHSST